MMRKRSPYGGGGHQRNNNNRNGGGGNGQMRRHHRRGPNNNNTQYEQGDDESVSPRLRRHAQVQREKYVNMAIDARRSGDRVQAEYWLQHADHYQRILNLAQEQFSSRGPSEEGDDSQGDMQSHDDQQQQQSSQSSSYSQHRDNNQYSSDADGSGEDDAYEPSYGNPAPAAQPRRPRQQHQNQQREQRPQRQSQPQQQRQEAGGGLEDVLPMPKPAGRNDRFEQDQDDE